MPKQPQKKEKKKKPKKKTSAERDRLRIAATLKKAREAESEFYAILEALQGGRQPIQEIKKPNEYVACVKFKSDRKLTDREREQLVSAIAVQVEDPSGLDGEKRADFRTMDVDASLKLTRKIKRRRK